MSFGIKGEIIKGFGGASGALTVQLPEFVKTHPELAVCRLGTINVKLKAPLRVEKPDFTIGPIKYSNGAVSLASRAMLEQLVGIAKDCLRSLLAERRRTARARLR
jgi:hypothetical protein